MVSFHELQELFLFSHAQGNLDDEELLLLYEEYSPKNRDFWYETFGRFFLDDVNDAECLTEFRVREHDLSLLAEVLQIPHSLTCEQRTISKGMENRNLSPIYTTENFWHGSDKNGTRTPKKGSARVNFVV